MSFDLNTKSRQNVIKIEMNKCIIYFLNEMKTLTCVLFRKNHKHIEDLSGSVGRVLD